MTNEIESGGMGDDEALLAMVQKWKQKRAEQTVTQSQPIQKSAKQSLEALGLSREEILKMVKEEVAEQQATASEEAKTYTEQVLKNFELSMHQPKSNLGMGEPFRMGRRITRSEEAPPSGQ